MQLRQFFETVFKPARLALADSQTKYQYGLNLRRFEEFLAYTSELASKDQNAGKKRKKPQSPTLDDLTDGNIGACCEWLQDKKKLGIASAAKLRENLVTIWKLARSRNLMMVDPEIPAIREPKRIPRAWNRAELLQLWQYLSRLPGDVGGVPENVWYCSLACVLWDTGERIGAVWQTPKHQIDIRDGWIVVRAEVRKGKASDRLYRLSEQSVELLKELFKYSDGDRAWPWPFCDTYLWQKWKAILKRCGLPTGREFSFHCLRKSHASHLKAAGGDARESLGHASDATTNQVYLDPRITGLANDPTSRLFRLGEAS